MNYPIFDCMTASKKKSLLRIVCFRVFFLHDRVSIQYNNLLYIYHCYMTFIDSQSRGLKANTGVTQNWFKSKLQQCHFEPSSLQWLQYIMNTSRWHERQVYIHTFSDHSHPHPEVPLQYFQISLNILKANFCTIYTLQCTWWFMFWLNLLDIFDYVRHALISIVMCFDTLVFQINPCLIQHFTSFDFMPHGKLSELVILLFHSVFSYKKRSISSSLTICKSWDITIKELKCWSIGPFVRLESRTFWYSGWFERLLKKNEKKIRNKKEYTVNILLSQSVNEKVPLQTLK